MSWYPGAVRMELQPESDSQPAIRPTQFIMHSIIAPWTARRVYEYFRDSSNLESHFGLGYSGDLAQFIGTQTRADANYQANLRPDGTGAVSIETASNTSGTDPWTDAQVDQLVALGVWLHREHGIPLRICRDGSDPGYGYHRLHPEWSPSGTACPGNARVKQFREIVFPRIANEAGAPPSPSETSMVIRKKEQAYAQDAELEPGVMTGVAFSPTDQGVIVNASAAAYQTIVGLVHLTFDPETDPGTLISGQFYLANPDGSSPSGYAAVGPVPVNGAQFVHVYDVPLGKTLRFRVSALAPGEEPAPVLLLHRSYSFRSWEA
jgi:N-acetylmuramoyl-L-alanine amidase